MNQIFFNVWPDLYKLNFYLSQIWFLRILILATFILILIVCIRIFMLIIKIYKKKKEQEILITQVKNFYKKSLINIEWREFIKKLINYIETLSINYKYRNIDEILEFIWCSKQDILEIKNIIYKDCWDIELTVKNLKNKF